MELRFQIKGIFHFMNIIKKSTWTGSYHNKGEGPFTTEFYPETLFEMMSALCTPKSFQALFTFYF